MDHLILNKIIKIVATSCQILRLKCTKFDFGWGSAPDSAGGAYVAPSLSGFKGLKGASSKYGPHDYDDDDDYDERMYFNVA